MNHEVLSPTRRAVQPPMQVGGVRDFQRGSILVIRDQEILIDGNRGPASVNLMELGLLGD